MSGIIHCHNLMVWYGNGKLPTTYIFGDPKRQDTFTLLAFTGLSCLTQLQPVSANSMQYSRFCSHVVENINTSTTYTIAQLWHVTASKT